MVRVSGVSVARTVGSVLMGAFVLMVVAVVVGEIVAPYCERLAQARRDGAVPRRHVDARVRALERLSAGVTRFGVSAPRRVSGNPARRMRHADATGTLPTIPGMQSGTCQSTSAFLPVARGPRSIESGPSRTQNLA